MLTYRCYAKGNGSLQFRGDYFVDKNGLLLNFEGVPKDATVTLEAQAETLARKLADGRAKVSKEFLSGTIRVTAATTEKVWNCEELDCFPIGDRVLVRPQVVDVSARIVELEALVDDIQKGYTDLQEKYEELLKDSKSGFDFN